MSKRTNFDIKDAACLHIVHNLQHPTSCLTTQSTQTTMVNTPKKNFSPLPAGRNGKSTKRSTQRCHQANEGKSGFEAERVRALGALRSLRSKKKLAAEKRRATHFLSNEETEQGNLSEDDEPGWVMGTITKTVQQRMERFRQKQMKFDELTQPGWEDVADYFRKRHKKYDTSELRVPAVVPPQTNDDAPPHPPTTFAELMESLDIVPGISQGTSRPGSSHIRLGSVKPQSKLSIPSGEPAAEPDLSPLLKAKPV